MNYTLHISTYTDKIIIKRGGAAVAAISNDSNIFVRSGGEILFTDELNARAKEGYRLKFSEVDWGNCEPQFDPLPNNVNEAVEAIANLYGRDFAGSASTATFITRPLIQIGGGL